jgi:hypothetical protein
MKCVAASRFKALGETELFTPTFSSIYHLKFFNKEVREKWFDV